MIKIIFCMFAVLMANFVFGSEWIKDISDNLIPSHKIEKIYIKPFSGAGRIYYLVMAKIYAENKLEKEKCLFAAYSESECEKFINELSSSK